MKLAISNIAWQEEQEAVKVYALMQQYGFSGLEIAPTKFSANPYANLAFAVDIRQNLAMQYNLAVISMQSLLFGTTGMDLFNGEVKRDKLYKYLTKAILYAEAIDCPVLVFGNPKNRVMVDEKKDYPVAVDFFKRIGGFAAEHGVCLCIEPNPVAYGTNFITNLKSANQLVNEVASIGFRMIIDTGTMLLNQDSGTQIQEVIGNTRHIHISMPFLKPLNQECQVYAQWLKEFIAEVKISGYQQYLSIEMINASLQDVEQSLFILANLTG